MKANQSKKSAPFLVQFGIYAGILFVSNCLSSLFPASFPVPATVIGLVLLYLLLTFHVIKVEWVDSLGSFLIGIIGFLFVPSGISLAANLNLMKQQGLQVILVIIISTLVLLLVTAYMARGFIWLHHKIQTIGKPKSSHHILKTYKLNEVK